MEVLTLLTNLLVDTGIEREFGLKRCFVFCRFGFSKQGPVECLVRTAFRFFCCDILRAGKLKMRLPAEVGRNATTTRALWPEGKGDVFLSASANVGTAPL